MKSPMVLILFLLLGSGCAFKDPQKPEPGITLAVAAQPSAVPVQPMISPVGTVELDLGDQSARYTRDLTETPGLAQVNVNAPLVLSGGYTGPVTFQFMFSDSGLSSAETISLKGATGLATAKVTLPSVGQAVVQLDDVSSLFKAGSRTTTVEFDVMGADGKSVAISVDLTYPPAFVTAIQETRDSFEARAGKVAVSSFQNGANLMSLVQVLTLKSSEAWPVSVQLPVDGGGQLTSTIATLTVVDHLCHFDSSTQTTSDVISDQIFLVPLSIAAQANVADQFSGALKAGSWSVGVDAGSETTVGIFAVGPRAAELADLGHTVQNFTSVSVASSCTALCGGQPGDSAVFRAPTANTGVWANQGWPGASRACSQAECDGRDAAQFLTPDLCSQCAEWELSNGTRPFETTRYCQSPDPSNPWGYSSAENWHVARHLLSVPSGTQAGPVYLRLAGGAMNAVARFSFANLTEQSSTGSVPAVLAAEFKQAD